jgi:hypothetical protein
MVGKIKTLALAVVFWSLREHSNSWQVGFN